jgi:hypothetical protein
MAVPKRGTMAMALRNGLPVLHRSQTFGKGLKEGQLAANAVSKDPTISPAIPMPVNAKELTHEG